MISVCPCDPPQRMRSPRCLSVCIPPNFLVYYAAPVVSKERRRLVKQLASSGSICYLLHADFLHDLFSTLKMETICCSEIPVDFQRNTMHYIAEDRTLHLSF
jgi:hypothetical protein